MKFLVVDDHALIRGALCDVLCDLRSGSTVLEAGDSCQALAALRAHSEVDLVLLDRHLPDRDGLDVLDEVRRAYPTMPVVILSGDRDPATIRQALRRGALGFVPKSETRDVLSSALALVLAGGIYVPPAALGGDQAPPSPSTGNSGNPTSPRDLGLTERQIEVLALLMAGKNNKMICRTLGLAEPTVKNHVSAVLRALGVGSRMEAVAEVARRGWKLPPASSVSGR